LGHQTFATRRVAFCAGHRVWRHESKCRNLHGHNYVALFHARAPGELDELGRVIDFSVLKSRLGSWIEEHWDHGFILWEQDEEALRACREVASQKIYLLPSNPTAENLARELLLNVAPRQMYGTDVTIVRVELWETENCKVEVTLEC